MPSNSYSNFQVLLKDVDMLVETHYLFSQGKVGKKKLGYLTRSAVVMLCAAWERYNENLLLESIDLILSTDLRGSDLPSEVKKYISQKVKSSKNEIYPLELADNGWRNLWHGYALNDTELLHTPNSENLNKLFKRNLGIETYTDFWKTNSIEKINKFISKRGEIAHRGSQSTYVRINTLRSDIDLCIDNAIEIDVRVSEYLVNSFSVPQWQLNYSRIR
jgi:hypothetical protein